MSKYMQLTVTALPYKRTEEVYPSLAAHLSRLGGDWASPDLSLYTLVGQLDQLLYQAEGTRLREVLLRYQDRLRELRRKAQEQIADWHLDKADQILYQIEDVFDEIEGELKNL